MSELDLAQSIWISQNLGELISLTPPALSTIRSENISKAFNLIINATCEGNIAAFAKIFNLPRNTVWMWCKSKSLPELRVVLAVCYCLNISLLDFLTIKQQAFQSLRIDIQKLHKSSRTKRASPRTLNYTTTEKYLLDILNSHKPPLTMKEVAEQLNINQRTIRSHFPNLCKAISSKYRNYQQQQTQERIQISCQEVEQAVSNLHQAGEYPSEARVSQLISQPGYFRYKEVRKSLNKAILDLGI